MVGRGAHATMPDTLSIENCEVVFPNRNLIPRPTVLRPVCFKFFDLQ